MQVTQERPRRRHLRSAEVPAECPQVIEDLISDCLRQSPADRPSAKAVCHILELAMQMQPEISGIGTPSSSHSANSVLTRPVASLTEVSSEHWH